MTDAFRNFSIHAVTMTMEFPKASGIANIPFLTEELRS